MNERLRRLINFCMYEQQISKVELADYMNMSYPTMLNKLKEPGTLRISEADRLCRILGIQLNELLTKYEINENK